MVLAGSSLCTGNQAGSSQRSVQRWGFSGAKGARAQQKQQQQQLQRTTVARDPGDMARCPSVPKPLEALKQLDLAALRRRRMVF